MILVTGSNERYRHRVNGYLASLQEYADFTCFHVGVGYQPGRDYAGVYPAMITQAQNAGAPPETECIQHGSFIDTVAPGLGNEVVLYTDGDFVMQRPLDDDDWDLLRLPDHAIAIGYNGSATETLLDEYGRLSPRISLPDMDRIWGKDWHVRPIYNAGCMAMTRHTWQQFHRLYMNSWEVVGQCFQHQARQQWLISWLISEYFTAVILPWSFHAHGHFGLKPGMTVDGGRAYVDGELALFRHFL